VALRALVWYRGAPVSFTRLSARQQAALLTDIVERCAHTPGDRPAPVVVFDLDGTLMDNRPRTSAILREVGLRWEKREPEIAKRLRDAAPDALAYLLTDTLARLGVTRSDLIADAEEYWRARFFRDEHLVHDVALPGAVDFAKACYDAGAILVYLTGRDLPLMGIGTFRSLRDLGFPIGVAGTEVILKPDASMPDEAFKRFAAPELARVGTVIAAFDNEPGNCNVFLDAYPTCASVFVDTQHMPGAPPLHSAVSIIGDFLR
jgi:hypothetical protein